jgi:hypothetical protein
MPQPVKLSDSLINAARDAAAGAHRSLAAQVEHWAALGRAIEGRLTADQSAALKNMIRAPSSTYGNPDQLNAALAAALAHAVHPASQKAFAAELGRDPEPSYSADPALPGCILRENADGTRTPGHWVNDRFVALETAAPAATRAATR